MIAPLVIDSFAGGGGASEGIRAAIGRDPDYALNHDGLALAMHRINHPATKHIEEDVWNVDAFGLRAGRHPVTYRPLRLDLPEVFETGGIVGEATIAACVEQSDSLWFVGRFGILMRDARPLPLDPCKGALNIFVPALAAAVAEAAE